MKTNSLIKLIVVLALGSLVPIGNLIGQSFFGNPVAAGGGLKKSPWYGWYSDAFYPYVWDVNHGWSYFIEGENNWLWMWNFGVRDWFVMQPSEYPFMYSFSENAWFWYAGGGYGNRSFIQMNSAEAYREVHGMIMPEKMAGVFEMAMFADDATSGLEDGASEQILSAIMAAFFAPETSTCPVITMVPEEFSLFDPPATIAATINFGDGCSPLEGLGLFSGWLQLDVSGLEFSDAIRANLDLIANNLALDGVALMDGLMNLDLAVEQDVNETVTATDIVTTSQYDVSAGFSFNNMLMYDETVDGNIDVAADFVVTERESLNDWTDYDETIEGTLTATFDQLATSEMTISNGTLTLNMQSPGTTTMSVNMNTSEGPVVMQVQLEQFEGGMRANTVGTSNVMGSVMSIDNVLWDYAQCDDPIGGSISLIYGDARYTVTFTAACDEGFITSKVRN